MNLILLPRAAPGIIIGIIWGGLVVALSVPLENLFSVGGILSFLGFSLMGAEFGTYVWYNFEERKNVWWRAILGAGIGVALAIFLDYPVEKTILSVFFTSLWLVLFLVVITISPKQTWYHALKFGAVGALIGLLYATFTDMLDNVRTGISPLAALVVFALAFFLVGVFGFILSWALFVYPLNKWSGTHSEE
jgi:hypothetical protein